MSATASLGKMLISQRYSLGYHLVHSVSAVEFTAAILHVTTLQKLKLFLIIYMHNIGVS